MIEILLEGLPPTPNQLIRMHWAQVAKEKKRWRTMTYYQARSLRPQTPYRHVELTVVRGSSRGTDLDNVLAAVKPIIDGLVDAGILADDCPKVVQRIIPMWEKAPIRKGFIKIIVREIKQS